MKSVASLLYTSLVSKHEFAENLLSDTNALMKGVQEFLLVLSIFLDRFELNLVQTTCMCVISVKISKIKAVLYVCKQVKFCPYFMHLSSDVDEFVREKIYNILFRYIKLESKVIPRQAEVALGVPGRLRPRIITTFGTTRVVGRQPNASAAFTPGQIPDTHFQRLS